MFKKTLLALALGTLAVSAQATTIKFDNTNADMPTSITGDVSGTGSCSFQDKCGTSLSWGPDSDGVTLTATAFDSQGQILVWDDLTPPRGGLGANPSTTETTDRTDNVQDNYGEYLTLTFTGTSDPIVIDWLRFNKQGAGHVPFGTGTGSLNMTAFNIADSIASDFSGANVGHSFDVRVNNDNWYLAGIGYHVPEPGTLALLGVGLAGLGAARRRRK